MPQFDFSIIIPASDVSVYLLENLDKIQNQKCAKFEVILVFNDFLAGSKLDKYAFEKKVIISTDGPAEKRNIGARASRGKWLAFIDDDAYPDENWLGMAKKYLARRETAAIGGPQLTPPDDTFWQKVSGAMFLSPLSGSAIIRYWPGKSVREIDDWPTVNFFVKREDFKKLGGFDSRYWPGEDTKLCLDIVKKLKKKILYIPNMIVFHHRRSGLKKHLKQVGNYGLHRGFFAKKFPKTSARLIDLYFVPSLWVIYLAMGPLFILAGPVFWKIYLLGIAAYVFAIVVSSAVIWKRTNSLLISLVSSYYLILFHIWYGIRFIQGLVFTGNLKSKLGR